MKKLNLYILLFILLLNSIKIYSQNADDINLNQLEKVNLFTDRSLYVAGENILFSASVSTENNKPISKVLYVELVDINKNQQSGKKLILNNFICNGFINIPEDIPTGIYYLKSYTKNMRNFGDEVFSYSRIKIINPKKKYISDQKYSKNDSNNQYSFKPIKDTNLIKLTINKQEYAERDTVKLKLSSNKYFSDSLINCCISVVPKNTANTQIFASQIIPKKLDDFLYYPETRGISLTGIVKDEKTNNNLASTKVNLSIIGENNDFMATYTNDKGQFFFSLPYIIGQRDIFLYADKIENGTAKILIDNDFSPAMIDFNPAEFYLTKQEQDVVKKLVLNYELSKFFNKQKQPLIDSSKYKNTPFYGNPTEVLYLNQYIPLPTVEDYFNELPFLVKVRKSHGHKYLKILGESPELKIYKPLILVDMVAISDVDNILLIPASYIKQIDIINTPYVKGDIIYGGIVSLISKNNDFAKINLPQSGTFINYKFISNQKQENRPVSDSNIPDTRNTLFWQPNIALNKNDTKSILFTTADTPGQYEIIINGALPNGKVFKESIFFNVKQ